MKDASFPFKVPDDAQVRYELLQIAGQLLEHLHTHGAREVARKTRCGKAQSTSVQAMVATPLQVFMVAGRGGVLPIPNHGSPNEGHVQANLVSAPRHDVHLWGEGAGASVGNDVDAKKWRSFTRSSLRLMVRCSCDHKLGLRMSQVVLELMIPDDS